MNQKINGFLQKLKQQAESLHQQTDKPNGNQLPPICDQDQYCSVDRQGEVYCLTKHHHAHEVELEEKVSDRFDSASATSPHAQFAASGSSSNSGNQVWQVSYELVEFIYSKNVSNNTVSNNKPT
jgi:hypothetical protein